MRKAVVLAIALALSWAMTAVTAPAHAAPDGYLWWPANGVVSGACGESRPTHTHAGVDIARTPSTPVHASYDGTVAWRPVDPGGYGNYLDVVHPGGWSTRYAHLAESPTSPLVPNGATVTRGQLIGHTAVNGSSTGLHVHFEIRRNGVMQCPANAGRGTSITGLTPTSISIGAPSTPEAVANGGGVHVTGPNSYTDVSSTGQVYAWNGGYHGGSPTGYSGRFVDAKVTSNGGGYWLLSSAGQVYAYGNAPYRGGSPTGYQQEIVAMAAMPDDQGYVMMSAGGQVYAYGSAAYRGGSPTGYAGRFVDVEMTPDGGGYWLLTSAGQVYAYGNAQYLGGSPTGFSRAVVAMSPTRDGQGYVMVSKAGQVYAYGNAPYLGGSPGGVTGEISDVSYRTDGTHGYVMVSTTGGHYAYGTPWLGNPTGTAAIF
ncbi:M23 family metallopeptidase [Streptosporangium sp. NPDC023615]|uniref:murein hydrolase activator EnvC family protein n=1 Tax=Streptosporangium sp. NPDC023615 TaxID=3154794 RepID=UPI003432D587